MPGPPEHTSLFSPVSIAGLQLCNRVVMPPMATAMEVGSDQFRCWYEARATGGVGLIVMEALWVSRLCEDDYCARLADTVQAIHSNGVPVILQLFQPSVSAEGEPIAPSTGEAAREATSAELAAMPAQFAQAAANCRQLGFDGVEPHGAHGFFLNQMFNPALNHRADRYGGSLDSRMRLGLEIVSATRAAVGAAYPIAYRHTMQAADGHTIDESLEFLGRLVEAGVDILDISPSTDPCLPPAYQDSAEEHCNLAAIARSSVAAPVIAVGGMEDPAAAQAALDAGKCDLCAVGRQLIADADWPSKVARGRENDIIACTKCDIKCFGNLGKGIPIGCVENDASGNEYMLG